MTRRYGWLLSSLLLVLTMLIGRWVATNLDDQDRVEAPYARAGVLGEPVSLRYADVEVTHVALADEIENLGRVTLTNGAFVVVELKVRARVEPTRLAGFALRTTDGREFWPDSRTSCRIGEAPTGIDWYGTLCFEVMPEDLPGAHLVVAKGVLNDGAARRDDQADIDLDIDASEVAGLGDGDPIRIVPYPAAMVPGELKVGPAPKEANS